MGDGTTLSLGTPSSAQADDESPGTASAHFGNDPRPPLALACGQAIFTSIRSPMGQGYRLVSTSRDVKAEEKIEITRRSPSHGSLCDSSADAVGLLSHPLATGRQCIACCIHAGVEHTARGGLRVYSHMALLEPADFDAVEADPLRVHAVMLEGLRHNGAVLSPPPCLDSLSLAVPRPTDPKTPAAPGSETAEPSPAVAESDPVAETPPPPDPALVAIAADLQAGRNVIITGTAEPIALARSLLDLLPVDTRRRLSMSVGLSYSPGRRLQLVVLPNEDPQLRRLTAGQDVAIHRFA